jgi:1,4-dihydroxy-2-naphthoate octaprenyltransferase
VSLRDNAAVLVGMLTRKVAGTGLLLRPLATLSWSGGALLLSSGLAIRSTSFSGSWSEPLRVLAAAVVIQGWLSHSLNDRTDWQTGTDCQANEFFSGGSGVLRLGLFSVNELSIVAITSLLLLSSIVWVPNVARNAWLFLAVGLWGAIAYSCRPWRLSYRPWLGEWLAAFPAVTACGLAAFQVLAQRLVPAAVVGAGLHGLLCVCWLMQHHLPDWWRDLQAHPPKRTTIAWLAQRFGLPRARRWWWATGCSRLWRLL